MVMLSAQLKQRIRLFKGCYKLIFVVLGIWSCLIISNQIFFAWLGMDNQDFNPLHLFEYAYMALCNDDFRTKWLVAFAIPQVAVSGLLFFVFQDKQRFLFGRAHWSSLWEAKKSGMLVDKGIILTKKWGQYIRVGGYEHVFAFWPSGSGKSSSLAIPNLLNWDGSCIVNDVKLTLFQLTSGFRAKHGQECFLWNPAAKDKRTHCYNPLDSVNRKKHLRIDGLQKIAHIFIPDSKAQKEPIWTTIPRALFVALGLFLMDTPDRPCTIGEIIRLVKNTPDIKSLLWDMIKDRQDLDPLTYRNLSSFLQIEPKLQSNLLQSFLSYFELFDNPLIDAATSKSDFDIRQLRQKPITIYVGISANNIVRLSPLISIFYEQVMDVMLGEIPDTKQEPYSLLLLMDEFSALRRMEILRANIGLMREYRVRLMVIIQDLPQLYDTYGVYGAKAFINNKIRLAAVQNDYEAAQLISNWLGDKTVQQRNRNKRLFTLRDTTGSDSESISYTKRPLIAPADIMQLPKEKMIIALEGNPPILANKNFWQHDANFNRRVVDSIAVPEVDTAPWHFDWGRLKSQIAKQEVSRMEDD